MNTETNKKSTNIKRLMPLVLALCILLTGFAGAGVFTVGYVKSESNTQQTIQEPVAAANDVSKSNLCIGGKATINGEPYSNGIIELSGNTDRSVTNSQGLFFFKNVDTGLNTLCTAFSDGWIIADIPFEICRSQANEALVTSLADGTGLITVPKNTAFIEIEVEIDETAKSITVKPDKLVCVTDTGSIITKDGATDNSSGVILTAFGAQILTDDSIVIPHRGVILTDGSFVAFDGSATLSDCTYISPNGVVTAPDGTITSPGFKGSLPSGLIVSSNGTVTLPIGAVIASDNSSLSLPGRIIIDFISGDVRLPDNTILHSNNTLTLPNGAIHSKGEVTTPGGVKVTIFAG